MISVIDAISVAMTHATLWVKPTFTPSSPARSALSELARSAMPMLVKRRNENRARIASTVVMIAMRCVGVEDVAVEVEAEVERHRQLLRREIGAEPERDGHGEASEQLRQADGDDHQDQARRLREPADDRELDERAEHDRRRPSASGTAIQKSQHRHGDERDGEARGHRAEVGLGEVDDLVGPVDEREAERRERGERTDDDAVDDLVRRDRSSPRSPGGGRTRPSTTSTKMKSSRTHRLSLTFRNDVAARRAHGGAVIGRRTPVRPGSDDFATRLVLLALELRLGLADVEARARTGLTGALAPARRARGRPGGLLASVHVDRAELRAVDIGRDPGEDVALVVLVVGAQVQLRAQEGVVARWRSACRCGTCPGRRASPGWSGPSRRRIRCSPRRRRRRWGCTSGCSPRGPRRRRASRARRRLAAFPPFGSQARPPETRRTSVDRIPRRIGGGSVRFARFPNVCKVGAVHVTVG